MILSKEQIVSDLSLTLAQEGSGGAATPELTLFFAAVQLPILPALVEPAYRRLGAGEPHGRRAG